MTEGVHVNTGENTALQMFVESKHYADVLEPIQRLDPGEWGETRIAPRDI
jgi:hypothetical protein